MTEPTDAELVAWLVPKLHTFKGAERVHFTRAPGCTMTDAELIGYMEGRVMWLPTTFCDSDAGVTDKFGVVHKPKPLYTTPQPTQAQAGAPGYWVWVDEVRQYLTAAADSSMSRNNSEQLASELLEQMPTQAQAGAVPLPKSYQGSTLTSNSHDAGCRVSFSFSSVAEAEAWHESIVDQHHGIKGGQHGAE